METLNNLYKNTVLNTAVKCIAICAMVVMVVVGVTVYKANVTGLAILILFTVVYVQLPGLMILRLLSMKMRHISTTLCAGFFAGWAFVTLQYFISDLTESNIVLYCIGPIFTIAYIASVIKQKERRICSNRFHFNRLSAAFCVFAALALFYALLSTQYLYLSPAESDFTYMNADKAYHIGLIDSLSHGWPLVSLWVQGRIIKYHVFTELLLSVPVRLFGVTADVAFFSFNPILTTYVFGLSTYVLFRELLGRPERAGLCSLIVMLSNLYLTRSIHTSLAFHFALINDNAVGYGISGAMLFLVLFKDWYKKYESNEGHIKELLFLTAFTMLLTGIKGPIAMVLVLSLWGTFIIGFILRKVSFRTALPLLLLSIAFLVVYVLVMGGKGTSNGSGDSIFAFATIANIAFFHDPLILFMKGMGLPKIIRLAVMLVVFMIFLLTAFILPFTIGYIREMILVFSGRKDYDFSRVLVYACFLVGLALLFVMNYSGHSQVYFGLVAVFLAPLITFWFFEDMEGNRSALMRIVRAIFVICLILTSLTLLTHFKGMIGSAIYHSDDSIEYNLYMSISDEEYNAMMWINENTPEDSLLATDRYSSVPPAEYNYENRWTNRFFLYATYANRFCYIAGSGYNLPAGDWVIRKEMIETNEQLYDPANKARGDLARELGVDYVIVSKRFNDRGSLKSDDYIPCYSNEDIDIYEISGDN